MVMDAMRINHSYLGESLCVDEKSNVDAVRFFLNYLNILMNHYKMGA